MERHERLRKLIIDVVGVKLIEPKVGKSITEMAAEAAEKIMDAVAEGFRSLEEVDGIVKSVKAGMDVQIAYWDPEEDAGPDGLPDPMVRKARWEGVELPDPLQVYVCSQYATRGDRKDNLEMARRYCSKIIEEGKVPICPHLFFGPFLDDDVPEQRELALRIGFDLMRDCSELRVYSQISDGMREEILEADRRGIPVNIGNLYAIFDWNRADYLTEKILKELEDVRSGEKHRTEEDGSAE